MVAEEEIDSEIEVDNDNEPNELSTPLYLSNFNITKNSEHIKRFAAPKMVNVPNTNIVAEKEISDLVV